MGDSIGTGGSEVVDRIRVQPREQPSKFEKYFAVAEYVFKNPGQNRTEILAGLGGKVSKNDFDPIEDFLLDNVIITRQRERRIKEGKTVWDAVYRPDDESKRDINFVRRYLESRLKN